MTKSDNYIPTHFLYFSLLFFSLNFYVPTDSLPYPTQTLFQNFFYLEFMYQLYRHTHTISTPFSPRPASGSHKFRANPAHTNQSTNDTAHTLHKHHTPQIPQPYTTTNSTHAPVQPPQTHSLHKHPQPYSPTPTRTTYHKHPQPYSPTPTRTTYHKHPHPHSLHRHPQPYSPTPTPPPHPHSLHTHTQTRTTPARPPTQTLTPSHREAMPCPDVVAAPMQSQPRTSPQFDRPVIRQDQAIQNRTGSGRAPDRPGTRQDQIEPGQARPDQIRPSQTRPSQTRSGIRQAVT